MLWKQRVLHFKRNVSMQNTTHRCKSRQPKMHTSAIERTKHTLRMGVRRVKTKAKQTQPGRVIPSREYDLSGLILVGVKSGVVRVGWYQGWWFIGEGVEGNTITMG